MNSSPIIASLATAFATALSEIENASKNSSNPHFRSKYADLAEVINTVRPVFCKHGLSVTQCPSYAEGIVTVTTVLMHNSGEWIASDCSAPVSKQDAQGVGSAITYCRRYALAAMACIAQEDDDANSAVGHVVKAIPTYPATKPSAAPASKATVSVDDLYAKIAAVAKARESDDDTTMSLLTGGKCKQVTDIETMDEPRRVKLMNILNNELKGA